MSIANPLWGAPRIHGELLKLGIDFSSAQGPTSSTISPSTGQYFLTDFAKPIAHVQS